jgi:fumarate reductase flavoprotein subunit
MELPPGWRGYGARNQIDHPDTAARQAEVDALRARYGADRFGLQSALMPFRHLLPPALRGFNERIDERFVADTAADTSAAAAAPLPRAAE